MGLNTQNPPSVNESQVTKTWAFTQNADGSLSPGTSGGGGGGNVNLTGINSIAPAFTNPLPVQLSDGTNPLGTFGNPLNVTGGGAGVQFADNAASGATPTGTLAMGWDSANSKIRAQKVDASQNHLVAWTSAKHLIVDSGAISATQGTSPWVVSLTSTTVTGTVGVTQSTNPWTIQGDSATGAAKAGNPVQIGGVFNTEQPTVTTGQTVEAQMTARGAQIVATGVDAFAVNATLSAETTKVIGTVNQGTNPWVVSLTSTTITGTVGVTQSTSPWVDNLTQVASTVLGAPQTFGTAPTGVVIGTSSDMYIAGTRARSNQTTTAAGVQDVNVVGVLGVTNSVTNGLCTAPTDGTTKAGVIAGTTALKTDMSSVAGTATVAATAGVQKVGISGAAAATLDAVITAATAPANAIATLAVNNTSAPSLTTGQSVALQCDYEGSLFVKPYRRAQTVAKATTIASSSSATTVLAAQAAGIFADITQLIITTTELATDVPFTATLSDGTNSFIYDLNSGGAAAATTAPVTPNGVNISFSVPLPATTAATAWTIALSVATVTVHITVVAVLQKAS